VGKVSKIGNTAFTFPIGSDLLFRSASISAPSNSTDKFSAQYFRSNPTSLFGTGKDLTLNNVSKLEYWDVSRDIGTSSVSVSLDWESDASGVSNSSDLRVAHWNSSLSKWEDLGKTNSITASSTSGFVTSNVTSNFSPFTLGSSTSVNPLPIVLKEMKVECIDEKIQVIWETSSEKYNELFYIEKSRDAIEWDKIGSTNSLGNTSVGHYYSMIDPIQISGNYYRLTQVDFDKKSVTFPIVFFDNNQCLQKENVVFYNSNTKRIEWRGTENNVQIELYDLIGKSILYKKVTDYFIDATEINRGIYIVKINDGVKQIESKIIIE
jgi:hypothetical protein